MKIVFFGTPDFVIPVVDSILKTKNLKLVAVVTNPDRPVGRKQILTPSPIKSWAQQNKIKIIDSASMIYIIEVLKEISPDLGILAAYGKIIPKEIIDLFPQGILVIHPSLLPKYRGASPIQTAILQGDKETGVSILQMDEKMDHGPLVAQFKEKIAPDDTAETLTKRLFAKTASYLISLLSHISRIKPIEQDHSLATFTKLLTKENGQIDWRWPPEKIERFVRAMTPWPGAWTLLRLRSSGQAKRLKIIKAHLKPILDRNSLAKLVIEKVQLEAKKPVSWDEFQKGYPEIKLS